MLYKGPASTAPSKDAVVSAQDSSSSSSIQNPNSSSSSGSAVRDAASYNAESQSGSSGATSGSCPEDSSRSGNDQSGSSSSSSSSSSSDGPPGGPHPPPLAAGATATKQVVPLGQSPGRRHRIFNQQQIRWRKWQFEQCAVHQQQRSKMQQPKQIRSAWGCTVERGLRSREAGSWCFLRCFSCASHVHADWRCFRLRGSML